MTLSGFEANSSLSLAKTGWSAFSSRTRSAWTFWSPGMVFKTFSISREMPPSALRQTGWLFKRVERRTSLTLPSRASFMKRSSSLLSSARALLSSVSAVSSMPRSLSAAERNSLPSKSRIILRANSSTSSVR